MLVSLQYGGIVRQQKQNSVSKQTKSSKMSASKVNFGRALSSDERKISNVLLERAFQINGVDVRAVVMPGAAYSGYLQEDKNGQKFKVDSGVGSPNSKAAQEEMLLLKDIHGINTRQNLPTGSINPQDSKFADKAIFETTFENVCPFSGSPLEKGSQTIDAGDLYDRGLVSVEDVKAYNAPDDPNFKLKNNYENYFAKEDTFFKKAFNNFKEKIKTDTKLQQDYNTFLNNKRFSEWIDKMAVSTALKENLYGNDNFLKWDNSQKLNSEAKLDLNADVDKRLFLSDKDERHLDKSIVDARLDVIKQDDACRESMEFFKFKQFIAYDQATKMHQFLNKNGMKEIADVPIGTSLLDVHAFPDAFDIDFNTKNTRGYSTLLCPMDPGIDDWGLPALKNNDAARNYVALKYGNALQSADTARIDGAWQLRHSFVGHHFDDKNFVLNAPEKPGTTEWRPMDGFFDKIFNVFKDEGKESGIANIVAENQGGGDRITLTKQELDRLGMPTIEINKQNCTTKNILSLGIHDHSSLVSNIEKREDQIDALARLYKGLFNNGQNGTNQIQITAFDLMGRKEQINDSFLSKKNNEKPANTPDERAAKKKTAKESPNWKARNPMNAEALMYRNLAGDNETGQKAGSNTYKALNRAFYQKYLVTDGAEKGQIVEHSGIKDAPFVAKVLQYFENVIEKKGPYTTSQANLQQNNFMREFKDTFGEKTAKILIDGYEELANKNIENKAQKYQQMMLKASEAFDEHTQALKAGVKKVKMIVEKPPIRQIGAKQVAAVATGSFVLVGALAQLFSMKNPSSQTAQKAGRISKAQKGVIKTLGNNVPSNITGASNKKAIKTLEKI